MNSSHGMGRRASDRKANRLPAQWTPRFSYIWMVKSGKTAPRRYRMDPLAARADADALAPYDSTRYMIEDNWREEH